MDDDFDDEELSEEERSAEVRSALFKALGIVVALAVVIAIGTVLMVGALGLDDDESVGPVGGAPATTQPLPTTALPVPGETGSASADEPTDLVTPDDAAKGPIQLSISPMLVRPMERVNLTGTYPGRDNVGLQVQRFEAGKWSDFGVSATVRVGTFETYVMTGRSGENRFRMFDPETDKGSNAVLVTIE